MPQALASILRMNPTRHLLRPISTLLAVLLASPLAAQDLAQSIAVVLSVQGARSTLAGQPRPLNVLDTLASGSRIELAPGAALVLATADGVWDVSGPGRVSVDASGAHATDESARVQRRATPNPQLLRIRPERVVQGAVKMRGEAAADLELMAPRGLVLDQEAWLFTWQGPVGKQRVELIDDEGELLASEELDGKLWRLPGKVKLQADREYLWRVLIPEANGRIREARAGFSLLSQPESRAWLAAAPPRSAPVAERVRYALALEQRGLESAAKLAWQELKQDLPELGAKR